MQIEFYLEDRNSDILNPRSWLLNLDIEIDLALDLRSKGDLLLDLDRDLILGLDLDVDLERDLDRVRDLDCDQDLERDFDFRRNRSCRTGEYLERGGVRFRNLRP